MLSVGYRVHEIQHHYFASFTNRISISGLSIAFSMVSDSIAKVFFKPFHNEKLDNDWCFCTTTRNSERKRNNNSTNIMKTREYIKKRESRKKIEYSESHL